MTEDNSRLEALEQNLDGNWSNEKMAYTFLDTAGVGQLGDMLIGSPDFKTMAPCKYQVFFKDNNPFLRIIYNDKSDDQIREYDIQEILVGANSKTLRLKDKFGNETIYH